jgi:hypothetical protein
MTGLAMGLKLRAIERLLGRTMVESILIGRVRDNKLRE